MSAGTRRILLIFALVLLGAAIVWRILIEVNSPVRSVCKRINSFGYHVSADDLVLEAHGKDMSLASLFEGKYSLEEIDAMVEASRKCGFGADIEKVGNIELLVRYMNAQRAMLIYTVDGEPELVFIEDTAQSTVVPIG